MRHADLTCEEFPAELKEALLDPGCEKWAFNAAFERVITMNTLRIPTPIEGWRCTMALANLQSFTGDLLEIGTAMGIKGASRRFATPWAQNVRRPSSGPVESHIFPGAGSVPGASHVALNWGLSVHDMYASSTYSATVITANEDRLAMALAP